MVTIEGRARRRETADGAFWLCEVFVRNEQHEIKANREER